MFTSVIFARTVAFTLAKSSSIELGSGRLKSIKLKERLYLSCASQKFSSVDNFLVSVSPGSRLTLLATAASSFLNELMSDFISSISVLLYLLNLGSERVVCSHYVALITVEVHFTRARTKTINFKTTQSGAFNMQISSTNIACYTIGRLSLFITLRTGRHCGHSQIIDKAITHLSTHKLTNNAGARTDTSARYSTHIQ